MNRGKFSLYASMFAHVWAWLVLLFLSLWPYFYQGVSATVGDSSGGTPTQERFTASLMQVNGFWVLIPLSIPILITGAGLAAVRLRESYPRLGIGVMWASAVVMLLFCLAAMFSIGIFYAPSAIALMVAAVLGMGQDREERGSE